jgi:hypothetical protein
MSAFRAFGISASVPEGWEARAFQHAEGAPTLHVANFALPAYDGEFGTRATDAMPEDSLFLTLTEYRAGGSVKPGHGLFAAAKPHGVAEHELSGRTLLRARPGQRGVQRFFTTSGRAFCLYVVVSGTARTHRHLASASHLLRTLRVEPSAS